MATKIRLKRYGAKHDPHFRIVVADERSRRDGGSIEELGHYCPAREPIELTLDHERALYWLGLGAQPSETVRSLLRREGVLAERAAASKPPAADAENKGDSGEATE
ncbi:MAG TPA: 30S ribosomal protein S16 [Armatimonadota bacterium]|nr:30S ribosomal protein S16 [Armatimonadota bacterium]